MVTLDISSYKHNPDVIRKKLEVKKNVTIAKDELMVMFPMRFMTRGLASIDINGCNTIAIYCIIDKNGNYAKVVNIINHNLIPTYTEEYRVNGIDYMGLHFEKDDLFLSTNTLIVSGKIMYDVFDEFYTKGKIPWYLDYKDIGLLFNKGNKYNGTDIGNDPLMYEILASVITRNSGDKGKMYRLDPVGKPVYVGLNNRTYSFVNTGSKLIGGYFKEGITNAVVDPETSPSESVNILRM